MKKIDFDKMTDSVFQKTQELIDRFGPRQAGSQSCHGCAEALNDDMSTFTDSVQTQDFNVHTGAFLGWIRMLVSLYVIGTVFLWLKMPQITAALLLIGILVLVFQFFLYKHMIDFLYPKKVGKNVMGTIEPEGEVKRQIIISGHHDSARIFNFFVHQPKLYGLRVMGGIGILAAVFVLSLLFFILSFSGMLLTMLAAASSAGLAIVIQLWFFASKKCSPGAGDNLIAVSMAVEALRHISLMKKEGSGLKNTRVIALSFDAEEEGLRGAYAFAKRNAAFLSSVPTYLFNIDCPYYLKDMFFLTTDINGSVKLSESFAKQCSDSAKKLGYDAKHKPITFLTGGTDAGELAKYGVHSTTMMAMPWDNSERAAAYHTPNDTVDAVEKVAVKAGLEIFFDLVDCLEKQA